MNVTWDELDLYGLSGNLWSRFAPPVGGGFHQSASGNPAIGFFDHFLKFGGTSLHDGYILLATSGCSVAQIATDWDETDADSKVDTGLGIVRLELDGGAQDDEAVLGWGAGLDVPFKLVGHDLCFEARVRLSLITANDCSWFVGLSEIGAAVTDALFDDASGNQCALASGLDHIGFQKLSGESTPVDGMYQAGGAKVDGAVNTDLDSLHTLVAADFVKLGFRFQSVDNTLHWFVNGVEDTDAMLKIGDLTDTTFPDDEFMGPLVGIKDASSGGTAVNLDVDWWACAQAIGGS